MGLTCWCLFVAIDESIDRISNAKFDRMIRHPSSEHIQLFAGQRIRSTELLIETVDRKPIRVIRATFTIFQFDEQGCVDADRYEKQQMAMVEVAIAPLFGAASRPRMLLMRKTSLSLRAEHDPRLAS